MTTVADTRVGSVLRDAETRLRGAGLATARQDAELLLARVLGTTRLALHLRAREALPARAFADFAGLVGRRLGQEPLQYVLGETDFCGLTVRLGPGVFIPRPETELLVQRALTVCASGPAVLIEPCTGTGAVACALAVRAPRARVWAVERSPEPLAWARENVRRLGLDARVTVVEGDLFAPLGELGLAGRCDLVVANPPYIARAALSGLPEEVRGWEPVGALDGGPDGLAVIRRILCEGLDFLRVGGTLLCEIGHDQATSIRAWLGAEPRYARSVVHRDFAGRDRVLETRRV